MIAEKQMLHQMIEKLPDFEIAEIIDFIGYLEMKRNKKVGDVTLASEEALAKDWLRPEEEEAWQDL